MFDINRTLGPSFISMSMWRKKIEDVKDWMYKYRKNVKLSVRFDGSIEKNFISDRLFYHYITNGLTSFKTVCKRNPLKSFNELQIFEQSSKSISLSDQCCKSPIFL